MNKRMEKEKVFSMVYEVLNGVGRLGVDERWENEKIGGYLDEWIVNGLMGSELIDGWLND